MLVAKKSRCISFLIGATSKYAWGSDSAGRRCWTVMGLSPNRDLQKGALNGDGVVVQQGFNVGKGAGNKSVEKKVRQI